MTVGELRKALDGIADDVVVLLGPRDSMNYEPLEGFETRMIDAAPNPYAPAESIYGVSRLNGSQVQAVILD